jgi:hypothetical protein
VRGILTTLKTSGTTAQGKATPVAATLGGIVLRLPYILARSAASYASILGSANRSNWKKHYFFIFRTCFAAASKSW